ncbi:MAG: membrane protein of unknown function [Promethearchaeota archaeon]|nr:MAG: membrane protein of unknown function [Candidatus Lokiarchaeota archaeon]
MDLIYIIIQILMMGATAFSFLLVAFRAYSKNLFTKESKLLLGALLCFLLPNFLYIFLGILPQNPPSNATIAQFINIMGDFTLTTGIFVLFLFFQRYSVSKYKSLKLAILVFAVGGYICSTIAEFNLIEMVWLDGLWQRYETNTINLAIYGFLQIYIGLIVVWEIYKMFKKVDKENSLSIKLNLLGNILMFIIPMFFFPLATFIHVKFITLYIPYLLITTGSVLFTLAFINNPALVFILTHNIYKLYVIHQHGQLLYSAEFSEGKEQNFSPDDLIAGAISGISSLMEESVKAKEIKRIEFSDKHIILQKCERDIPVFSLLIAEKGGSIVENCLKNFTNKFCNRFETLIREFSGELTPFNKADAIVDESFAILGKRRSITKR